MQGHTRFYTIRIGDYRLGFKLKSNNGFLLLCVIITRKLDTTTCNLTIYNFSKVDLLCL